MQSQAFALRICPFSSGGLMQHLIPLARATPTGQGVRGNGIFVGGGIMGGSIAGEVLIVILIGIVRERIGAGVDATAHPSVHRRSRPQPRQGRPSREFVRGETLFGQTDGLSRLGATVHHSGALEQRRLPRTTRRKARRRGAARRTTPTPTPLTAPRGSTLVDVKVRVRVGGRRQGLRSCAGITGGRPARLCDRC